ncbi:MAG: hypothetical protein WCE75_09380 [Terracidiphilus sp.]
MSANAIYAWCIFAGMLPFLSIVVIVVHYCLFGVRRPGGVGGRRRFAFGSARFVLGMAFQFLQVLYQPSVAYAVEAKLDDKADEDDTGDPESLKKQLSRQLRRIRRGERVERLVLRL